MIRISPLGATPAFPVSQTCDTSRPEQAEAGAADRGVAAGHYHRALPNTGRVTSLPLTLLRLVAHTPGP